MKGFEVLLVMFICIRTINSSVSSTATKVVCSETEREAPLSFKKGLKDKKIWLSSWIGEDCCTWKGVSCNNRTGHVVKLNLRQQFQSSTSQFDDPMSFLLGGEINPSLLEVKHLKYLDLSMKNFNGTCIPEFLGSHKSLRYLNLSNADFFGMVPHQLGNLSSFRYLDLSTSSLFSSYGGNELYAENFQWLSHLSFLQYLDMSHVDLSEATDYLQVLNMLPSLMELFLSSCELNLIPDLPSQNVNFTSLTIIDLSENYFGSSVPDWLFSIRGLVSLIFETNDFHGPIPSGLQNLTSLRVLDLSNNKFNSTIPDWLYNLTSLTRLYLPDNELEGEIPATLGNLCKLQELDLSSNYLSGSVQFCALLASSRVGTLNNDF